MKKKPKQKSEVVAMPHFNVLIDRLEINENRTVYLWYKIMKYKNGVPRQVGKATINLFQELRALGFSGDIKLSLLGDRGIQWEQPRRM